MAKSVKCDCDNKDVSDKPAHHGARISCNFVECVLLGRLGLALA